MVSKVKKWVKHNIMGTSLKEIELNRILDKISTNKDLSDREERFLFLYTSLENNTLSDYLYMAKNDVFDRIDDLLKNNKIVICDLFDRDGKIGLPIKGCKNHYDEEFGYVIFLNGSKHKVMDNHLYNITYDKKRDRYSLHSQDEYYEKLNINRED